MGHELGARAYRERGLGFNLHFMNRERITTPIRETQPTTLSGIKAILRGWVVGQTLYVLVP